MKKDRKSTTITLAEFTENFLPKNFPTHTDGKRIDSNARAASQRGKEIVHEIKVKFGL